MRIVFTCACGNVAEIEAESLQLANMVVCSSRWVLGTNYMADGSFQEYSRCPKCREEQDPGVVDSVNESLAALQRDILQPIADNLADKTKDGAEADENP